MKAEKIQEKMAGKVLGSCCGLISILEDLINYQICLTWDEKFCILLLNLHRCVWSIQAA
jgi:hypothetical protein